MITSLLSALILGTARAADGADKIPRWVYVCICLLVTYYCTQSVLDTAAWMWVLCVLTMLPPHALFSALHNEPAGRTDGKWGFLQTASHWMMQRVMLANGREENYYEIWAIMYGFVRSMLIIPAVIWLNEPWLMLAMLQGVLMWVCGKVWPDRAVRAQEFISAAFIGAMM